MTQQKREELRSFLTGEIQKWVVRMMLLATASTLLWIFTPLQGKVAGIWNSPEQLSSINTQLGHLTSALDQVTGENRVIRQFPGQSYVTEPVRTGELVTLNLVVQRTNLGKNCRLKSRQSLFVDSSGIPTPGKPMGELRQITTEASKVRVVIQPPENLAPGRIELYLALEYDCNGKFVPDRTDTVYYILLEG